MISNGAALALSALLTLSSCANGVSGAASGHPSGTAPLPESKLALAHGVFVAAPGVPEDAVPEAQLDAYVAAVGQPLAYVYLTNNWFVSRAFPAEQVTRVQARGAAAFVRLMLRSSDEQASAPEALYTLSAIIGGQFDAELRAWGEQAAQVGGPV